MDGAGAGGGNGYSSAKRAHVFRAERDAIHPQLASMR